MAAAHAVRYATNLAVTQEKSSHVIVPIAKIVLAARLA